MKHFINTILLLFLAMTMSAQGFVTPQMYGAKADGKTDDTKAIQKALDSNNAVFFPAGTYITSTSLIVHSNTTLWGTGRESRIVNNVNTGYEKNVLVCGSIGSGEEATSPNLLPKISGKVSDDRWSASVKSTNNVDDGDLILISSGKLGTHNPQNAYITKVKRVDKKSKTLYTEDYISHPFLAGEVSVQVLKNFPTDKHLPVYVAENVCVHDLSIEQSIDEGSGMYVMLLATYKSSFYNLWLKGNTCIGSNMTVKSYFTNIDCSFDGGVVDSPEYFIESKYSNLHGRRYGNRMNQIGLTILHGYSGVIENCDIDFGGNGKVGMLEQVRPVVTGNRFRNLSSKASGIQGSQYGSCLISHNVLTSTASYPVVAIFGKGNVITDNWIETAVPRWLSSANQVDYASNDLSNNHVIGLDAKDALYQSMPRAEIATISSFAHAATVTIKPGEKVNLLHVKDVVSGNTKLTRVKFYFEKMTVATVGQDGASVFKFSSPTLEVVVTQGYITYASSDNSLRVVQKGDGPIVLRNMGNSNIVYTMTTIVRD